MYHVVIYWRDGLTKYVGTFRTANEACAEAAKWHLNDCDARITVARF